MRTFVEEDIIPDIRYVIFRKCTPAWEIPEESLGNCNLTYLISGESRYTINGNNIDLAAGNLLFLPRGSVRRGITFPGRLMHCFSVDFDLRNSKGQSVALPFPISSLPGRHEDIVHMFHDLFFSWLNKQPGYGIKSRGLFLQIIHRFLELVVLKSNASTGDPRITRVIHYIAAHYPERITVKMMAKMAGLNPTYFGLLFSREMGTSLNRYLIQTRVRNAENMLTSGEYKVSDAAEACGFTDMSHFYKQFKLIKGFPPSHSLPKKF
ncbi:MAG: AraC family transcriptional regulator [Treponema sp.]|jgi:AraC-like DNA-binding protein|nr:AraC family transcriptional regulator [Treponema sp.]